MGILDKLKELNKTKTKDEIQAVWDSGNHWDDVGAQIINKVMNFEEFAGNEVGAMYPLEVIIYNLETEQIVEIVEDYVKYRMLIHTL